jgi:peroxiredoxin
LVLEDKAPDFTLQTINGEMIKLSDFKGKTVMINMWWAGCEGCVEEIPHIQKAFTKISENNPDWAILTINVWDTSISLRKFIENKKITFSVLIDPDKKLPQGYLKYGVPTTFFLDVNGIVREVKHEIFQNPDEIEATFMSLQRYNLQ